MENSDDQSPCHHSNEAGCESHAASPELHLPRQRRAHRPWEAGSARPRLDRPVPTSESKIPRRWDRFLRLVGEPAARRLLQAHVVVFGLGGVGSFAAESLARSAIGQLTLVDFDDVCVTNVNRQLQAFPGTVGQSKATLLAERVQAINPDVFVEPIQAFYSAETSAELLSPRPDFVIDAIDNVTAKLHLIETCLQQRIPIISATGSGARLDPTQVRIADLSETRLDPLARTLRRQLAARGFDTSRPIGLPVAFSEEPIREPIPPTWDEEAGFRCICPHAADSPHACEKRRVIYGTASFVTAAFGLAMSAYVVRSLVGAEHENSAKTTIV
jgi:tRNA A37 threonylcarbamoyladenosine dehydratase